jgi:hypothetical protein
MITSYNEVVNFNCVTIGVVLTLSEQLLCNWHMMLMHTIMPRVWLGKVTITFGICNLFVIKSQPNWLVLKLNYN